MNAHRRWLTAVAFFELLRFDLLYTLFGFARTHSTLAEPPLIRESSTDLVDAISCAVARAGCLYWKPVLCLQRSVAAMRLMRRHGMPARLVIGYREMPFTAHAWVEVDGRVANDSQEFARRFRPLYTA